MKSPRRNLRDIVSGRQRRPKGTLWTTPYGPWTPKKVGAQMLTWHECILANVTLVADTFATAVVDMSGNSRALVQNSSGKQPKYVAGAAPNGHDILQFDGVNDFMKVATSFGGAQPYHVFHAVKWSHTGVAQYLSDGYTGSSTVLYYSVNIAEYAGNYCYAAIPTIGWHVWGCKFNGNQGKVSIDGVFGAVGNCGTNNANGFTLGSEANGSYPSTVDWAASITYLGPLSDDEHIRIAKYLKTLVGI